MAGRYSLKGSRDTSAIVLVSDQSMAMRLALDAMLFVEHGSSERHAIQRVVAEQPALGIVKRYALRLLMETVSERDLLDKIIGDTFLDRKIGGRTRCLLRITTHLLRIQSDSPSLKRIERYARDLASVFETSLLELLVGSVHAVDADSLTRGMGDSEKVAFETHYPRWWVEYCFRVFGRDEAIKILSAGPRPRYVRINPLRNSGRTSLPDKLKRFSSLMTRVGSGPPVYTLSSSPSAFTDYFSEGLLQVQDFASFLAVSAAEPKPGEKVLDLCAAPGGKTAALAQLMRNRGKIVSVDYSRSRMQSWNREVSRLGVKIAEPIIGTAESLGLRDKFELIVIDPPCTGTGILDRHPGMKWRLTPPLLSRYSALQSQFLDSAATLLADGGRMLYCTCSLTLEENEHVVRSFLRSHSDFETSPVLKEHGTPGLEGFTDCRRLWPHREKTAGYFVARLQRVN